MAQSDSEDCTNKKDAKVRFADDEEIKGSFKDVDEVDHAVPKVKKIHILKNRSSSEQSFMLTSNSLKERVLGYKHSSLENLSKTINNNNNLKNKNLNEETTEKKSDETPNAAFKKNANVYSVFQAKTLSERRKSLPTLPKAIAAKASERYQRSFSDPKDDSLVPIKELRAKAIRRLSRGIGRLLRRSSSINISEPDPVYKVAYLGNVLTGWAKGEGCVDKPLATLWRNYNQSSKPDVVMKLSVTNSGLKGFTKEHGLTEYWSHRITYCASPPNHPKIFCWVYRHEGRKLKHELRCHAVLCSKDTASGKITEQLQHKLQQALSEFKRDKISRQNARLSLANAVYDNPNMPRRKILLSVGGNNYRPPLERSKSAPKLMAIEELVSEEDEEEEELANKCNTWTKSASPSRKPYRIDELYPSYTLGRRRSDRIKSPRKISLPERAVEAEVKKMEKCHSLEDTQDSEDCHEEITGMSFSDEVFSLLIEESKRKSVEEPIEETPKEITEKTILEHLCAQSTYLVLDSDEGSISSGCETASTVTSSDIDMNSLPCHMTQQSAEPAKMSVLQRVQSFEQLCSKPKSETLSPKRYSSFKATTQTRPQENELQSEDVNEVPIGEKISFKRRSTYPPVKVMVEIKSENTYSNSDDSDTNAIGDNDSACSDESGYSELLENGYVKEGLVANTVMV